jgi:transmembrane protein
MNAVAPSTAILWLCRIGLCAVYVYSGLDKLIDFRGAVVEQTKLGLSPPALFAMATIATQLGGSALVLFTHGWPAALGAVGLGGFTLLATFIGHPFWRVSGDERSAALNVFLEHFGLIAGLVLLGWVELWMTPRR